MWSQIMRKLVAAIDPKLDKYRKQAPKFAPKTTEEFLDVLRRTPKSVFSDSEREKLVAVMCYKEKRVADLMVPKNEMVFVNEKDYLGPLMLDKLYRSGFVYFPVVDNKEHVKGVIHTESLNALEIKKTDRAEKYISKDVKTLNREDTLEFAIAEILRTGQMYFLVLGKNGELAGFFTLEAVFSYFGL